MSSIIKPDQKGYEAISKLITSEAEAVNEYGASINDNFKDSPIRHVLAHIQAEESFHIEQLVYLSHLLAGGTYEPSDPKVKEEVLNLLKGKTHVDH